MKPVLGAVIIPLETNLNLRIEKALMRRPRPLAWSATNPAKHDRRLLDTQRRLGHTNQTQHLEDNMTTAHYHHFQIDNQTGSLCCDAWLGEPVDEHGRLLKAPPGHRYEEVDAL